MSLGPDARALLDAARGGDDPTDADAARLRAKLAVCLGAAAAAGATATFSAKTAAATKAVVETGARGAAAGATGSTAGLAGAKVVLALALAGAASSAVLATSHDRKPTANAPPTANANANATANANTNTNANANANPNPNPNAPATAPAPVRPPSRPGSTLADELSLLSSARAHLAAQDGRAALADVDAHASRFPRGVLAEERDALRVHALCRAGRAADARAAASAFVARRPGSPQASAVLRACATGDD